MQVYNTRRQRGTEQITATLDPAPSPQTPRSRPRRPFARRLPFVFLIIGTIFAFGIVNLWLIKNDEQREKNFIASEQQAAKDHKATLAALIEKRYNLAREAESVARANQPFDESKYFRGLHAKNPGCDVKDATSLTVILNKKHCLAEQKWQPTSLVEVAGVQLQKDAASSLSAMMADAEKAGVGFEVTSGFRTFDDQQALYAAGTESGASSQPIDLTSARPGHSEHQTGLSADFKIGSCSLECFGTTRRYEWLKTHAIDYGYIERYPSSLGEITGYVHEPWHWRYVGPEAAKAMKQQRIETMEMYFGVSGGDYY